MEADYPDLYLKSHGEAFRRGETQRYMDSFRQNVCCARAIEQTIVEYFNEADEGLKEGCAQAVLDQFGFRRVCFVLANSLQKLQKSICWYMVRPETYKWGEDMFTPPKDGYDIYYEAYTAVAQLEMFIDQTRAAYQALGLFGPEHCVDDQDYRGKVLVLRLNTLPESCWDSRNQLWYVENNFGCTPHSRGEVVSAISLGDGKADRWNRSDFAGVLDEQYLPDWALEKLEELRGLRQEQTSGPAMGGIT